MQQLEVGMAHRNGDDVNPKRQGSSDAKDDEWMND
jgi:hypothetical protein